MRVSFEVTGGPHKGLVVEVDRHQTLLAGRSRQAQLRIDKEPFSSRFQFRVVVSPPRCYLLDLGSNNGTFINGEKTTGAFVGDGDIISLGKTELRVRVSKAAPGPVSPGHADGAPAVPPRIKSFRAKAFPAKPFPGTSPWADVGGRAVDGPVPIRHSGYRILREIARGSRGSVYRAKHRATETNVALKAIRPHPSATRERVKRFLKKAVKLNGLDHPGIMRYLEIGNKRKVLYAITEYVRVVPIERIVRDLSAPERIHISCSIACLVLDALKYAHAKSLIHRDIKPANVLLFRRQKRLTVKLADFGLAKTLDAAGLIDITSNGEIRGSSAYMAPELIVSSRFAKPACDLYSLGATLYYYLAGQPPFGDASGAALLHSILNEPPFPIRGIAPEIPQALADVIERALAKDPARRWASANEMYNALFLYSKRSFVKRIK